MLRSNLYSFATSEQENDYVRGWGSICKQPQHVVSAGSAARSPLQTTLGVCLTMHLPIALPPAVPRDAQNRAGQPAVRVQHALVWRPHDAAGELAAAAVLCRLQRTGVGRLADRCRCRSQANVSFDPVAPASAFSDGRISGALQLWCLPRCVGVAACCPRTAALADHARIGLLSSRIVLLPGARCRAVLQDQGLPALGPEHLPAAGRPAARHHALGPGRAGALQAGCMALPQRPACARSCVAPARARHWRCCNSPCSPTSHCIALHGLA